MMANIQAIKRHRLRIMRGIMAWEGGLTNARVRELFDVGVIQASRLLADFRVEMGDQVLVAGRDREIRPVHPTRFSTDMPLDEYALLARGAADNRAIVAYAHIDLTQIAPANYAAIRQACQNGVGVTIQYASMANPKPHTRTIFPHAIVQAGRRWHVRAWCATRQAFRDFNLGRIYSAKLEPTLRSPQVREQDALWNLMVTLQLVPHRGLEWEQQVAVRKEFFRDTAGARYSIRACLVKYVIQDLHATTRPESETPPEFQIEVANAATLSEYLFPSPG